VTYVPTTADLAARWRLALAAVAAALALSASGVRLWPFLGALLVFDVWVGFLAGQSQARMWRRTVDATLAAGVADVDVTASPAVSVPRASLAGALVLVGLAATGVGGGTALAVWGSVVAASGGWSFGRGTGVAALESDRGWRLHWPEGSCHRPGIPRLVAVPVAPARPRSRSFRWALVAAAAASAVAVALGLETLAAVRAYAGQPLPVVPAPSTRSRIEPVFGRVATALAGRTVEVRCWSAADWPKVTVLDPVETGGFADLATGTVNLPPSVCGPLDALAYSPAHRFVDATWQDVAAAHILAHEAAHLGRAGSSEVRAECDAVQTTARAAELLGADAAYARWMASLDWTHLYPDLPASYRSRDCAPGGALDLHLADGWPAGAVRPAAP
jgi:hypothetical protein